MTAAVADVVTTRVPQRSWRSELRAVKIICGRDLIRFRGNPAQIMTWLIQPLLYLFALGTGLESLSAASTDGVELKTFIFPGVICMTVLFTAIRQSDWFLLQGMIFALIVTLGLATLILDLIYPLLDPRVKTR